MPGPETTSTNKISVLIADDSLVFRRFLRDSLLDIEHIDIVGEAVNGIEALDIMLKTKPDVILMDMEMPLMDGMTALQHLMIHRPTPTIMFSSLTDEGTARAFDALKNGAIDFVCKDFVFQSDNQNAYKKILRRKIIGAAKIQIESLEPIYDLSSIKEKKKNTSHFLFCEECGGKTRVEKSETLSAQTVTCSQCGDTLELTESGRYHSNSCITVIGGGEGSFRTLLHVVPQLNADIGGSLIVVVKEEQNHVVAFAKYLDAISDFKVFSVQDGMRLEGGCCYITSGTQPIFMRPYSAHYTLQLGKQTQEIGTTDMIMASVASIFKERASGVLLSGNRLDGLRGLATIAANGGEIYALNPAECMASKLVDSAIEKCSEITVTENDAELVKVIDRLHSQAKRGNKTA